MSRGKAQTRISVKKSAKNIKFVELVRQHYKLSFADANDTRYHIFTEEKAVEFYLAAQWGIPAVRSSVPDTTEFHGLCPPLGPQSDVDPDSFAYGIPAADPFREAPYTAPQAAPVAASSAAAPAPAPTAGAGAAPVTTLTVAPPAARDLVPQVRLPGTFRVLESFSQIFENLYLSHRALLAEMLDRKKMGGIRSVDSALKLPTSDIKAHRILMPYWVLGTVRCLVSDTYLSPKQLTEGLNAVISVLKAVENSQYVKGDGNLLSCSSHVKGEVNDFVTIRTQAWISDVITIIHQMLKAINSPANNKMAQNLARLAQHTLKIVEHGTTVLALVNNLHAPHPTSFARDIVAFSKHIPRNLKGLRSMLSLGNYHELVRIMLPAATWDAFQDFSKDKTLATAAETFELTEKDVRHWEGNYDCLNLSQPIRNADRRLELEEKKERGALTAGEAEEISHLEGLSNAIRDLAQAPLDCSDLSLCVGPSNKLIYPEMDSDTPSDLPMVLAVRKGSEQSDYQASRSLLCDLKTLQYMIHACILMARAGLQLADITDVFGSFPAALMMGPDIATFKTGLIAQFQNWKLLVSNLQQKFAHMQQVNTAVRSGDPAHKYGSQVKLRFYRNSPNRALSDLMDSLEVALDCAQQLQITTDVRAQLENAKRAIGNQRSANQILSNLFYNVSPSRPMIEPRVMARLEAHISADEEAKAVALEDSREMAARLLGPSAPALSALEDASVAGMQGAVSKEALQVILRQLTHSLERAGIPLDRDDAKILARSFSAVRTRHRLALSQEALTAEQEAYFERIDRVQGHTCHSDALVVSTDQLSAYEAALAEPTPASAQYTGVNYQRPHIPYDERVVPGQREIPSDSLGAALPAGTAPEVAGAGAYSDIVISLARALEIEPQSVSPYAARYGFRGDLEGFADFVDAAAARSMSLDDYRDALQIAQQEERARQAYLTSSAAAASGYGGGHPSADPSARVGVYAVPVAKAAPPARARSASGDTTYTAYSLPSFTGAPPPTKVKPGSAMAAFEAAMAAAEEDEYLGSVSTPSERSW